MSQGLFTPKYRRGEYALSELGESMRPILDAMLKWGQEYKNAL